MPKFRKILHVASRGMPFLCFCLILMMLIRSYTSYDRLQYVGANKKCWEIGSFDGVFMLISISADPLWTFPSGFTYFTDRRANVVGELSWMARLAIKLKIDHVAHLWRLLISEWLLLLIAAVVPLRSVLACIQKRSWDRSGRCTNCGYIIMTSSPVCPECGKEI
jgi:hypothetical protein